MWTYLSKYVKFFSISHKKYKKVYCKKRKISLTKMSIRYIINKQAISGKLQKSRGAISFYG